MYVSISRNNTRQGQVETKMKFLKEVTYFKNFVIKKNLKKDRYFHFLKIC